MTTRRWREKRDVVEPILMRSLSDTQHTHTYSTTETHAHTHTHTPAVVFPPLKTRGAPSTTAEWENEKRVKALSQIQSLGERGLHHLRQLARLEQLDGNVGAAHQLAVEVDLREMERDREREGKDRRVRAVLGGGAHFFF